MQWKLTEIDCLFIFFHTCLLRSKLLFNFKFRCSYFEVRCSLIRRGSLSEISPFEVGRHPPYNNITFWLELFCKECVKIMWHSKKWYLCPARLEKYQVRANAFDKWWRLGIYSLSGLNCEKMQKLELHWLPAHTKCIKIESRLISKKITFECKYWNCF